MSAQFYSCRSGVTHLVGRRRFGGSCAELTKGRCKLIISVLAAAS